MLNSDVCCPKFDPVPWDGVFVQWAEKRFIRDKVSCMFHLPLGFGKAMVRLNNMVEKAGAEIPDNLCLSENVSMWNMGLLLAVDRDISGASNVSMSGKFLCKVFEGPYKDAGKWCRDFESYAKEKGVQVEKQYLWYTTCPKCAREHGKNYTVIFGKVAP